MIERAVIVATGPRLAIDLPTSSPAAVSGRAVAPQRRLVHMTFRAVSDTIGASEVTVADRSRDWFAQAERDLEQARASRRDERHEWACFAAQQASENSVKALHLALGQEARGHTRSPSCSWSYR